MISDEPSWVHCNTPDDIEKFYVSVIPKIREAAKECGYGIGLHGSMRRDLDLIAIPWVEEHSDKDVLAAAIQKAACGFTQSYYPWVKGTKKPCGREAVSFPICWTVHNIVNNGHIDLSVMPSLAAERERVKKECVEVCDSVHDNSSSQIGDDDGINAHRKDAWELCAMVCAREIKRRIEEIK